MNKNSTSLPLLPLSESHFYTLRLWEVKGEETGSQWRARLQHVPSGEVKYFRNLEVMLDFLYAQLDKTHNSLPEDDEKSRKFSLSERNGK